MKKCRKCGSEFIDSELIRVDQTFEDGIIHIRGSCPDCGAFIKFISRKTFVFYFGKYKGQTLGKVMEKDMQYINWLLDEKGISEVVKRRIRENLL